MAAQFVNEKVDRTRALPLTTSKTYKFPGGELPHRQSGERANYSVCWIIERRSSLHQNQLTLTHTNTRDWLILG